MSKPAFIKILEDELETLGKMTPDEIALRLWKMGHRGTQINGNDCPLADLAYSLMPSGIGEDEFCVEVTEIYIRIVDRGEISSETASGKWWGRKNVGITVELPESVEEFVCRFDDGLYPELIRSS